MNTKTCYRFDEKTHEYRCTDLAFQEPIELTYPLPANCTFIEPPVVGDFEIAIFDGKSWEVKPDYRKHFEKGTYVGGKPYFNPNKYFIGVLMVFLIMTTIIIIVNAKVKKNFSSGITIIK